MNEGNMIKAGEMLQLKEEIEVLTSGASMRPMLRQHRDVVVIKRINRKPRRGDVVLYPNMQNNYILHRIIKKKNGKFIIRGDNNYFTERDIPPESIVGILTEFYRDGVYINCEKNKKYKLYTFYILHSYAFRYVYKKIIKPVLSKMKHKVLKDSI